MNEPDLLTLTEFLKEAQRQGVRLSLRGLQLYYSPRYRLLPKPVYQGGHIAHMPRSAIYLLRVVTKLNLGYGIALPKIQKLLTYIPDKYYPLVISGTLPPVVLEKVLDAKFDQKLFKDLPPGKITDAHVLACRDALTYWAKNGGAQILADALNSGGATD